jgi:hypothetical protein
MMVRGGKGTGLQMPSMSIPPPETATNVLTQNIGEGLKNAGMNVERRRQNNSLDASLLSKHV